jgi:hypothetical protein
MKKVKEPDKRQRNRTALADIKSESEDLVLKPQNQPPQITEPPKEPLPISCDTAYANTSRSSTRKCFELILWLLLMWVLGVNLGLIFTVLSGLGGLITLLKE